MGQRQRLKVGPSYLKKATTKQLEAHPHSGTQWAQRGGEEAQAMDQVRKNRETSQGGFCKKMSATLRRECTWKESKAEDDNPSSRWRTLFRETSFLTLHED